VLNRRNFLKAGVTAGAGVAPLASALSRLEAMPPSSTEQAATPDPEFWRGMVLVGFAGPWQTKAGLALGPAAIHALE